MIFSPGAVHTPKDIKPKNMDWISLLLLMGVIIWISVTIVGKSLIHFIIPSLFALLPAWVNFIFALTQALLLFIPIIPLALLCKKQPYKDILRLWGFSTFFGLVCSPILILPATASIVQGILHILISILLTIGLLMRNKHQKQRNIEISTTSSTSLILVTLLLSAIYITPWLALGAPGSWLDNLVQLTVGLSFGVMSVVLFRVFIFDSYTPHHSREFFLNGIAIATSLGILYAGMGLPFGAMQFLLIVSLTGIGWLISTIMSYSKRESISPYFSLWILIGITTSAPLIFFDPDELSFLYNATRGEILNYAAYAAVISFGLSWLTGLVAFGINQFLSRSDHLANPRRLSKGFLIASTLTAWVGVMVIYLTIGQPGFHGEGIFIILDSQADVSQALNIADPIQRRAYVYHTLTSHAMQTQVEIRQVLDQFHIDYTPYYLVNAIQVTDNPLLQFWLLTRSDVDRILANPWLRPLPSNISQRTGEIVTSTGPLWNLELIGVYQVWSEFQVYGSGIVVGQSDSGVQWDHPEIIDTYRGRSGNHAYNWLDPWYDTSVPMDFNGHGTHTLGTILGANIGIAPDATWFACANLIRPLGNPSLYLDCLQFMLAPYPGGEDPFSAGNPALGANIINNSWGCPPIEGCDPEALHVAVTNLRQAGIFVVASAGNDGPFCSSLVHPIANYDESFTVGSIDNASQLSFFSSLGPAEFQDYQIVKPDIVAPGENILSSTPGNTYDIYSGTSMAGPHVAGVVALMWSANPDLIGNIDLTEQIIIDNAEPYTGALPNCPGASDYPSTAVGYGIINAYTAVRAARALVIP
jgi:hypothetical protein